MMMMMMMMVYGLGAHCGKQSLSFFTERMSMFLSLQGYLLLANL